MNRRLQLFISCSIMPIAAHAQIASVCESKNSDTYFERWKFGANTECKGIKAPDGWELVYQTKEVLAYLNHESLIHQDNTVKFWVEFMFAEPFMYNGKTPSDNAKILYKFDCQNRQQTLVQATYNNKDKPIGQIVDGDLIEEIEPGTVSDSLFKIVCPKN